MSFLPVGEMSAASRVAVAAARSAAGQRLEALCGALRVPVPKSRPCAASGGVTATARPEMCLADLEFADGE